MSNVHGASRGNAHRLALLAIIALAAALRLYRLEEQSLWGDEYAITAQLQAPDLATNFRLIQMIIPEHAVSPFYYVLQYYWAHYVGFSLPVLRLLPIFFSVLSVFMICRVGRYLFGRTAGLIAALCMALSPQFIWFGQEVRSYALFYLLVLVASYALLRGVYDGPIDGPVMVRRSWKWWGMNLTVNALLPWVHALAPVFLFVQGLFLLILLRKAFRRLVYWGVLQCALLLPWTLFAFSMPYRNDHVSPGLKFAAILDNIFAGDLIVCNTELLPAWKTIPAAPLASGWTPLLAWRSWFDAGLVSLSALALSSLFFLAAAQAWRFRRARLPGSTGGERPGAAVFLLLLCVVPPCVLGLAEGLSGQVLGGIMYAMYGYAGLYLGLGALCERLRPAAVRPLCAAPIMLLYGFQLAVFLPETTRADWRGAAEHVQEQGTPRDLVLDIVCYAGPGHAMEYYLPDAFGQKRVVNTFQAACDEAAAFFLRPESKDANVWLTLAFLPIAWDYPWAGASSFAEAVQAARALPVRILEEHLSKRGLRVQFREFPGHHNVILGRARAERTPTGIGAPVPGIAEVDCDRILADIGYDTDDGTARELRIAALRRQFFRWPEGDGVVYLWHALSLLQDGYPDIALALAQSRLQTSPGATAPARMLASLALAYLGKDESALLTFQQACAEYAALAPLLGDFMTAVCRDHDRAAAWRETQKFRNMEFFLVSAMHAICGRRFS